jgi:hypothetical protein
MSVTTQIFIYLIFVCIGVAIGAFANSRRKSRGATLEAGQPAEPQPPVETQAQVEGQPSAGKDSSLAKEGEAHLLSAWKTIDGRLWLEMDGQRLEWKEALQSRQRQRLVNIMLDLRPWLSTEAEAAPPPVVRPSVVAPDKRTTEDVKTLPIFKSILEQIDDILQVKLEASAYKARKIQLVEGPGGTVIIKDGLNRFEGIEAVPDPLIQELIRQSVKDWEKGSK